MVWFPLGFGDIMRVVSRLKGQRPGKPLQCKARFVDHDVDFLFESYLHIHNHIRIRQKLGYTVGGHGTKPSLQPIGNLLVP